MSNLFIVAAPSGCGKTSLVESLINDAKNLRVSISHTTRNPRVDEVNGTNYHFVSVSEFQKMVSEDSFIEHAEVFENFYGTSKKLINDNLDNNIDVILEIDWQGARQVNQNLPSAISIFILPPSKEALELRLKNRAQDDVLVIKKRMLDAENQMSHFNEFDYLVINDDFNSALTDLKLIISSSKNLTKCAHLSLEEQSIKHKKLLKKLI
ncbi:MAG: guanylate kinase [Candidatus Thioglobus sp.]|jgi:guanylate kinase|nr:guanylate kinase [Candidatus Thioglobus sp.]